MTGIHLKVVPDRECALVPMQVELDLAEFLTEKERENFHPSLVRMMDKATGRVVPCQFSPHRSYRRLRGTLSWIMPNEAQTELKVNVSKSQVSPCPGEGTVIWDRGDSQLEVFLNREHVTSYIFNEAYERPFLYPLTGPDGLPVTRSVPNFGDHPHHKGIGLAVGDVSGQKGKPGIDFWGLGTMGDPGQGRVVHQAFTQLEQGPVFARIREENIWRQNDELEDPTEPRTRWKVKNEGEILLTEERTITVWNVSPLRIIDMHTILTPACEEVVLNADVEKKETAKENGPLTIRVADNMRGTAEGTIVNSEGGRTEKECWGRRARWVDYYGPVVPGGPVNGVAAMDHPSNIRHPTGWHVRDYGLFAANPFYSKKPEWPDQGPVHLSEAKGDRLVFIYRIYVHRGDEKQGKVEQKWQDWVNPPEAVTE